MAYYFEPTPNMTDAYYTDGTDKWFGKASKGASTAKASWQIFMMDYTGNNWIIKYPVDTVTNLASDAPKFIWDSVATYTYRVLGT